MSYRLLADGDGLDVTLDHVDGYDGVRWAIRQVGCCLNKRGKWEREPMPSSRTDAFKRRCRWLTAGEALAFWVKSGATSRFVRRG